MEIDVGYYLLSHLPRSSCWFRVIHYKGFVNNVGGMQYNMYVVDIPIFCRGKVWLRCAEETDYIAENKVHKENYSDDGEISWRVK